MVAATLGDHLLVQLGAVDDTDEDPDSDSVDGAVARRRPSSPAMPRLRVLGPVLPR